MENSKNMPKLTVFSVMSMNENKPNTDTENGNMTHNGTTENHEKINVEIEDEKWKLLYKVSDSPSIFMTFLFAFQQTLMSLPFCVMNAILVAQSVCADNDYDLKTKLLSTTIVLSSITTFLQSTFGIRLPLYQGPTPVYIVPILVLSTLPDWKCPATVIGNSSTELNGNHSVVDLETHRETVVFPRLRAMQGSLILAGGIHMLIGLTGLVGQLMKVIGPLTIVPIMVLIGIELQGSIVTFLDPHWGVAAGTLALSVILTSYLDGWNMPLPMFSRSRGFHIIRYPLQQVLAILISIIIGWIVCGIMTYAGVLTSDPLSREYKTRTDYGADTIQRTPWFIFPYPGQFGKIEINFGIVLAFLMATLCSITESMADYVTCSRICHVPPPPLPAVSRGIMVEGFMTMIAGMFGAAHGTTTYSNNIGTISMTKVASRAVFQALAVQLLVCGILGKLGAVFVTIPYPVLGGSVVLSFGMFLAIMISYIQYTDMNSSRNLSILGVSLFTGLMVPNWVKKHSTEIRTGNDEFDRFILMVLTNPSFFGGLLGFILDNTIAGTKEERGLYVWSGENFEIKTEEGTEIYEIPWLTKRLQRMFPCLKYFPVFPTYDKNSWNLFKTSKLRKDKNGYTLANVKP